MLKYMQSDFRWFVGFALTSMLSLAFGRSYVRIQTTLIGYELGDLKDKEASLLERRSHLQMELAKLTTKTHLTALAEQGQPKPLGAFAAQ